MFMFSASVKSYGLTLSPRSAAKDTSSKSELSSCHQIDSRKAVALGWIIADVFVLLGFGSTSFQPHRTTELNQIDAQLEERVTFLNNAVRRPPSGGDGRSGAPSAGPDGPPEIDGGKRPPPHFEPALDDRFELDRPRRRPPPDFRDELCRAAQRDRPGQGSQPEFSREIILPGEELRLFPENETNSFYAIWSRSEQMLKQSKNAPPGLRIPSRVARDTAVHVHNRGNYRECFSLPGVVIASLPGFRLFPLQRT